MLNFGYCAQPKISLLKPLNLITITYGIHDTTWIPLAACIGTMAMILWKFDKEVDASLILISLISGILAPSPTMTPETNKSALFNLWLFVCCVLGNIYRWSNSSYIIAPPEEEAMQTLLEAANKNYSLVFKNKIEHWVLLSAMKFIELERHTNGDISLGDSAKAAKLLLSKLKGDL